MSGVTVADNVVFGTVSDTLDAVSGIVICISDVSGIGCFTLVGGKFVDVDSAADEVSLRDVDAGSSKTESDGNIGGTLPSGDCNIIGDCELDDEITSNDGDLGGEIIFGGCD